MIRFTLPLTVVTALGGVARAESCPPAVTLAGDPALVEAIGRELGARGIRGAGDAGCPALRANVAWRGAELVVVIENPDGSSTERSVNEAATAATVIESFARSDVASPLLAARAVPASPSPDSPALPPFPPRQEQPAPGRAPSQSIHLLANFESSFATDSTTWLGASAKICIKVGPMCAAARFRAHMVVEGLRPHGMERDLIEVLIGVDVPIELGRLLVTPGFAGGLGGMETRAGGMKRETGAFRAEANVSLSVPIASKLAVDLSLGASFGEQNDFDGSTIDAPLEPWGMFRTGLGLRYTR